MKLPIAYPETSRNVSHGRGIRLLQPVVGSALRIFPKTLMSVSHGRGIC